MVLFEAVSQGTVGMLYNGEWVDLGLIITLADLLAVIVVAVKEHDKKDLEKVKYTLLFVGAMLLCITLYAKFVINGSIMGKPETEGGSSATSQASGSNLPPEAGNTSYQEFSASHCLFGSIKVSSYAHSGGSNCRPQDAFDNNRSTAWQDGTAGYGEGEWLLAYNRDGSTEKVSRVTIYNGYQDTKYNTGNKDFYQLNSRVKEFTLTLQDGTELHYRLKDLQTAQTFDWGEPIETSYVRITIDSVYKGQYSDTCITDIVFS